MSFGRNSFTRTFGLRLALWYAALFVVGAAAVVVLTYTLTKVSLEQRDRQIIQAKLGEYASIYQQGGPEALTETVRAEQRTAPERLFVRALGGGAETIVLSDPEQWDSASLEVASLRLRDGTLVEVGKSTEARDDLLARFRAALGIVTLSIVVVAFAGGYLATQSAIRPIQALADAVRRIVRTGQTDLRVPVEGTGDAIDELSVLVNAMLEKIEGLVAAMRGALDNVSHDLRTPLTRLRGLAEMALAGSRDADRYGEALADCVEQSDRVLVMLNTLMDISEAESGAMQLARAPIPVAELVGRAVDLYRDVAEAKGVSLGTTVPADLIMTGDRTRLEQVMANLLDNAVKYTPSGGRVEIAARQEDARVLIDVRDSGIGVPTDEIPHIWDRLFRGDRSRAERGLGLGLTLVKAVVEAHGGSINVESTPGHGSSFIVSLPL